MTREPKIYTSVGSTSTPSSIMAQQELYCQCLGELGWVLRSGRAPGSDQASEKGCDSNNPSLKEIYLPYAGFPREWSYAQDVWRPLDDLAHTVMHPTPEAMQLARELLGESHWNSAGMVSYNHFGQKAHGRNCHQVLGLNLRLPSRFVLLYAETDPKGEPVGGTRTAWLLATTRNIPTFNIYITAQKKAFEAMLTRWQKEQEG